MLLPRHQLPATATDRTTNHVDMVRHCFALIDTSTDRAVFTRLYRDVALAQAAAIDHAEQPIHGPLAGLPISIKDLFDVAGETTTAGSLALRDNPPALRDAPAIARLRAAGAIVVGKTNMSELAYSGLGLNPHFGTPRNALRPDSVPGGSSAGAGVAVAHGFSVASIGSDTGGSIRIPAAFNGVIGFKPTQARVSRAGMVGLSSSQDTVGPLARTVACCALLDAVMAGSVVPELTHHDLTGLRIATPTRFLTDDLDAPVASAFEAAVRRLANAGARIVETPCHELDLVLDVIAEGGLVGPEAYRTHQGLLASPSGLDPHVRMQIERFAGHPDEKYQRALKAQARAQAAFARLMDAVDILACPTVASVPPRFADLLDEDTTLRINRRVLRNTSPFNILDVPAITLPCHEPNMPPVGLMLVGRHMQDIPLLAIAHRAEAALSHQTDRLLSMPAGVPFT